MDEFIDLLKRYFMPFAAKPTVKEATHFYDWQKASVELLSNQKHFIFLEQDSDVTKQLTLIEEVCDCCIPELSLMCKYLLFIYLFFFILTVSAVITYLIYKKKTSQMERKVATSRRQVYSDKRKIVTLIMIW